MPLAEPPPRDSRFGSPLKLSKVHWVRPELVVEVTYLTWTEDNLLRQVSYQGPREDKPAGQVVRPGSSSASQKALTAARQPPLGNAVPVATLDADATTETLEVFGLRRGSPRPAHAGLEAPDVSRQTATMGWWSAGTTSARQAGLFQMLFQGGRCLAAWLISQVGTHRGQEMLHQGIALAGGMKSAGLGRTMTWPSEPHTRRASS